MAYRLTNAQARRFILRRLGLIGEYQYSGRPGAAAYIRHVQSIQIDPVDACGKSHEVTLHARVREFTKPMVDTLLYKDRDFIELYDKCFCIVPVEDWPCFENARANNWWNEKARPLLDEWGEGVRSVLEAKGPLCPKDLAGLDRVVDWYTWSNKGAKLANAVLEAMYHTGEVCIHHREGGQKYYHLTDRCIPGTILEAPHSFITGEERNSWFVKRRIAACGMLWNRASDAWLGTGLKTQAREAAFVSLLAAGEILPVEVEGLGHTLYCLATDRQLLETVAAGEKWRARCEVIAPLDSLIWDRKLVAALFGFSYRWEIYTPPEKRQYGFYVRPVLWGERFVGRVEFARDGTKLRVVNFWPEHGLRQNKQRNAALARCFGRFAKFNGCDTLLFA